MAGQRDRELAVLADLVELLHTMEIASRADDPGMRFFASTTREYLEGLHARMAAHGLTIAEVTAVVRGETTDRQLMPRPDWGCDPARVG